MFEPIRWTQKCTKNGALGTNGLINISNYCTHFIKLAGWQLSGVAIGWMKIFPGGNLLCGNYPGGNFPSGNFPSGSFPRWQSSGWEFSWVGIVQVGLILGGNFLWWKFSRWELSGGNHPGGNFQGGSFHVTLFLTIYSSFSFFFWSLWRIHLRPIWDAL